MTHRSDIAEPPERAAGIQWNWSTYKIVPEYYDRVVEAHRALAQNAQRILEIGVGCGYALSKLGERSTLAVGLDYEHAALERTRRVAHEIGAPLRLVQGDGTRLPFRNGSFDLVYSVGVIEHFEAPVAEAFLGEHLRVVRPGGIVAVSVPNKWNVFHSLLKAKLGSLYPYHPEKSYSPPELASLLRKHGLHVEGRNGWGFFWSLWDLPWRWSYNLSAVTIRMGCDHTFETRFSPAWRSRLGMMTMVWGRLPRNDRHDGERPTSAPV